MSDLKSADEIIGEYPKPNSMVDNGNLFFACATYQSAYKKLQAELMQEREKANEILKYCKPHVDQMWAACIVGIILNCDFRDAKSELAKYDKESE